MGFFRKGRRWLLVLGLAVLVLIVGVGFLRGRVQALPPVEVQPVGKGDLAIAVQARGVVEAADPVDIRSPFNGQLLQIPLEEVKARVAASAAGPAEEAAARAAVTAAREALAQVREQRSQVELRSPAAGTLLQVEVDAGESVTAGQLLMRLADLDVVEVIAEVDEVDIAQVRPGAAAAITVPAYPEQTFAGEVVRVSPTARREGNVAHFDVWVRVPNPQHLLRPGMSASVTITGDRRADVLVLPLAALTVREGSNGVFVLEGQTVRFRPVETGLVSTTQAEVIAGLGEGDTVVVGPLAILRMLQDGTPVQAIPVGDVEP